MRLGFVWLGLAALVTLAGCGDSGKAPATGDAAAPQEAAGQGTEDLQGFGQGLEGAVEIAPGIFQTRGTANAQLVVTADGNVVIDTGLSNQPHVQEWLGAVNRAPITHLVLTHAHADHYSGAAALSDRDTEVIAHPEFLHNQRYLRELAPLLMARNAIFFPEDTPALPGFLSGAVKHLYPQAEPTRLVADRYAFEQGGVRFEVIATPGAEGSDSLSVWLPEQRILFTGDLYGHIFPMWPNLTTIRGERPRYPKPYMDSLDLVAELEPVMLVPSHFEPVEGRERIRDGVRRMRAAVAYVEQAVFEGMNAGKDVHTLMREIELPDELAVPEVHGKVSWGVRSIWEAYTGWFQLRSTTELYAVPPSVVHAELAALAGGADAVAGRAAARLAAGEPVAALHLVEVALAADRGHRAALEVRLGALEELQRRGGGVNHYETMWLRHRIERTRGQLGG